jgi:hypothetical protein
VRHPTKSIDLKQNKPTLWWAQRTKHMSQVHNEGSFPVFDPTG